MPSFEQEGKATLNFLKKLNLMRIAILTQNE